MHAIAVKANMNITEETIRTLDVAATDKMPLSGKRLPKFFCNNEQLIFTGDEAVSSLSEYATTADYTVTTPHWINSTTGQFHSSTDDFTQLRRVQGHGGRSEPVHIFVLYSAVFLLALVGNSLVMITLASNKRMRTVTNSFLLSLSLSDLSLALVCMPISLTGRILKRFIFGSVMCKVLPYLMGISVSVSTFTMLAISIERYNAICNPLTSRGWQTKSHACKVIAVVWLLSFAFMSPFLGFSKLQYIPIVKASKCTQACRLDFGSREAQQAWYVLQIIILFAIPGVLMSVAYAKVCLTIFKGFDFDIQKEKRKAAKSASATGSTELSRLKVPKSCSGTSASHTTVTNSYNSTSSSYITVTNSCNGTSSSHLAGTGTSYCHSPVQVTTPEPKPGKRSTRKDATPTSPLLRRNASRKGGSNARQNQNASQLRAKKRVVKMLIVIVAIYFVCWTPLFIANVWKAFDPKGARKSLEGGIEIIQLMSYVSTCVNPVIYCFMHKKFREGFVHAFLCCMPAFCIRAVETKQKTPGSNGMCETDTRSTVLRSPRTCRTVSTEA